ncbi:MAG: transaldolase family protein [Planctomycetes bacterium]|nr:transaldolase family protein [Planctomycetota bacterium]
MKPSPAVAQSLHEMIREGFQPRFGELQASFPASALWAAVRATGTAIWLDTGDVEAARKLWTREMEGLTTNNTLLNAEIQKGLYDAAIPEVADRVRAAAPRVSRDELVLEIAFALNALHGLKLVEAFDCKVSVELHTALADDLEATVAYARRYHAICPERFIVKIPLTPAGLLAARIVVAEGIPVNYTLGFSARQNYVIARLARATWCNVFMGRLNAYAADEKLCDGRFVGEKATLASQRGLLDLRSQGIGTKQIGASMRGPSQVADLAGLDVFTIPVKVAQAFVDSRPEPSSLRARLGERYEPQWASGVDPRAEGLNALWEIDAATKSAVDACLAHGPERLDGQGLQDLFHRHGAGNLFPRYAAADLEAIARDGKLPKRERWKARLAQGEVGLDALLTTAGLLSFTADQAALDQRVASLI